MLREEHRTDAIRRTLIQARDVSWLDVDERVLQKGKPAYLPDGLELLSSSHNSANGDVFHTYSTYARGTEQVGGTHYYLDMTALGRQEDWEEPAGRAQALGARADQDGAGAAAGRR